jgi:CRISPR/Cas system-associated exonuclease Cas4 (RecB family)
MGNQKQEVTVKIDAVKWLDDGDRNKLGEGVEELCKKYDVNDTISLPMGYLSTSQVEMFLRCPKQYEFRYIKGMKSPPTGALIQGSAIHNAFEVGYNHKKESPESIIELDAVMDAYSDYVRNNLTNDVILDEETPEKVLRSQGEAIVERWHKDKLPYVQPTAVEKPFAAILNKIPVVGIIDLVDNVETEGPPNEVIVDNKTSGKRKTQDEADGSLQLSLYAAVTQVDIQRLDVYVRPRLTKKGMGEAKLQEIHTMRTFRDIYWMQNIFSDIARAISTGVFPPTNPNNWTCSAKWCGYWEYCRGRNL